MSAVLRVLSIVGALSLTSLSFGAAQVSCTAPQGQGWTQLSGSANFICQNQYSCGTSFPGMIGEKVKMKCYSTGAAIFNNQTVQFACLSSGEVSAVNCATGMQNPKWHSVIPKE